MARIIQFLFTANVHKTGLQSCILIASFILTSSRYRNSGKSGGLSYRHRSARSDNPEILLFLKIMHNYDELLDVLSRKNTFGNRKLNKSPASRQSNHSITRGKSEREDAKQVQGT